MSGSKGRTLERVVATAGKGKFIKAGHIAESLFLNYFTDNLSETHVQELVDIGMGPDYILMKDYLHRFGCPVNGSNPELAEAFSSVSGKNPKNYNRNRNSFGFPDVDAIVASSFYETLIKNQIAKDLIPKAKNVNDLKAIYFIDRLHGDLIKRHDIFSEDYNPEQSFMRMVQVLHDEKPLKFLSKHTDMLHGAKHSIGKKIKYDPTQIIVSELKKILNTARSIKKHYSLELKGYEDMIDELTSKCSAIENTYLTYERKHTAYSDDAIEEMEYDLVSDERKVEKNLETLEKAVKSFNLFGKDHSMFIGRMNRQKKHAKHLKQVRSTLANMDTELTDLVNTDPSGAKDIKDALSSIKTTILSYKKRTDRYLVPIVPTYTNKLGLKLQEVNAKKDNLVRKSRNTLNSFSLSKNFKSDYEILISKTFSSAVDNLRILSPDAIEIKTFAGLFEKYGVINERLDGMRKFKDDMSNLEKDIFKLRKKKGWFDAAKSIKERLSTYKETFFAQNMFGEYVDMRSEFDSCQEKYDDMCEHFKNTMDVRLSVVNREYLKRKETVDSHHKRGRLGSFFGAFNIYSNLRLSRARKMINSYVSEARCIKEILTT